LRIKNLLRRKNNMGEIIATTEIKREKGFIYYTATDDKGMITIGRAKAGRKKKEE